MEIQKMPVADLIPYEDNPRLNFQAIDYVAESIKQCGYITPIVVDENLVILAGHTRLEALKLLGYEEAEVRIVKGLTDDQKRKFRILDNKTGELAEWDYNKLAAEIVDLDFEGYDFQLEEPQPTADEFSDEFELPDGEQPEMRTLSFNLKEQQWTFMQTALDMVQDEIEETFGNIQLRGNELYAIAKQWLDMRTGGENEDE